MFDLLAQAPAICRGLAAWRAIAGNGIKIGNGHCAGRFAINRGNRTMTTFPLRGPVLE
jgi:hypothetical protein